jgi:prepilin-type N-terminal cleavage/methylation domain-containing protein
MKTRAGFTLVELLVVLLILVAIAGTALQSSWQLAEDSRLEETRRTLDGLELALLGESAGSGFVSDIGRLPLLSAAELPELVSLPAGMGQFAVQVPSGDARVRIGCGWRGPYWRGPFGSTELRDGWGRELRYFGADGVELAGAGDWRSLVSRGRDGLQGGAGYDTDLALVLEAPLQPPRHTGSLIVRVEPFAVSGPAQTIVVRIFGPENGAARTLRQEQFPTSDATLVRVFDGITTGARVVCVYQTDSSAGIDPELPVPGNVRTLPPRTVLVPAGGLPELFLDLSAP